MNASEVTSEIVRGVVAVAVVGGYIYLAATGQPIPESYGPIVAGVIGFFFGVGGAAIGARLARGK